MIKNIRNISWIQTIVDRYIVRQLAPDFKLKEEKAIFQGDHTNHDSAGATNSIHRLQKSWSVW